MGWHKYRKTLKKGFRLWEKKRDQLTPEESRLFEFHLKQLDQALLLRNREEAETAEKWLTPFIKTHFRKTATDYVIEFVGAILFAVVVAFLIRQFWFELYEVPTGSMRPTVKELDRMVVSKTTFGIHVPFSDKMAFYDDDLLKRAGIVVFTVGGMDVADSDMLYFHVFPGKKRYIKRCVAKPGDTIYFYGGRIYGIDREDNPITTFIDDPFLKKYHLDQIDHVPYITFEGRPYTGRMVGPRIYDAVTIKQMNVPVAKIKTNFSGKMMGEFFDGRDWRRDRPEDLKMAHTAPVSYADLWGIGNYAMARLLTQDEIGAFYNEEPPEAALLFLEMHHTPNLSFPQPEMRQDEHGRVYPMITPMTSFLPLSKEHLDVIRNSLTTARFYVKSGRAFRYSEAGPYSRYPQFDVKLGNIPDGCYEFDRGVGYKIHFGGISTKLPADHPLYANDVDLIQTLYNLGFNFNILFEPAAPYQPFIPQRFAYYRDGDLYTMGVPLLKKDDPMLKRFIERELRKQERSSSSEPYIAFVDHGPPLKDDQLDIDFIKSFGLHVPENHLVALGDNYAMSADSRDFGFVPTSKLRGAPSFTFWPPGNQFGPLNQPPYPWLTFSNLLIWALVIIVILGIIIFVYLRKHKPYFKD